MGSRPKIELKGNNLLFGAHRVVRFVPAAPNNRAVLIYEGSLCLSLKAKKNQMGLL